MELDIASQATTRVGASSTDAHHVHDNITPDIVRPILGYDPEAGFTSDDAASDGEVSLLSAPPRAVYDEDSWLEDQLDSDRQVLVSSATIPTTSQQSPTTGNQTTPKVARKDDNDVP